MIGSNVKTDNGFEGEIVAVNGDYVDVKSGSVTVRRVPLSEISFVSNNQYKLVSSLDKNK